MKRHFPILLLLMGLVALPAPALHIVGGEIYYECLNASTHQYRITLKIYRDCQSGGAAFDNPAVISIFNSSGNLIKTDHLYSPSVTPITPNLSDPCLVAPPNLCVEEGIYTGTVTLPPISGGYTLVYQRCCRNPTIANLTNPQSQGATYIAEIPDTSLAKCNNSAKYKGFPPVVICKDEPINFDHSATDADGDSLAYRLCNPRLGGSQANPAPNPASSPPYSAVNFNVGFNFNDPLNASPKLTIDPVSGFLTGVPTQVGQFVVGVCVDEFRNGALINTTLRDFQFNVADCNKLVTAKIKNVHPDTLIVHCEDYTVSFDNKSQGATSYHWDFGVQGTSADTSVMKYPTFTFPDTGTYYVTLIANPGSTCSDTDYVYLKLYPFMNANFTYDAGCEYMPVIFNDSTLNTENDIIRYEWDFDDGTVDSAANPEHLYSQEGHYDVKLTVENARGCVDDTTIQLVVHPQPDAAFTHNFPCLNKPTDFTDQTTIPFDNVTDWEWHFDNLGSSNQQNPSFTFKDPGIYSITLVTTSDYGCVDTAIKDFDVLSPPLASVWQDTTVCFRGNTPLRASGGLTYEWSPSTYLSDPNIATPIARPEQPVTYTVKVSDSCYWDTASVSIDLYPQPDLQVRPDTSLFRGDSVWIYATANAENYSYAWFPKYALSDTMGPNTFAFPQETTTFFLTATDSNGCQKTEGITIYVRDVCEDFYAPNAFSPNNDGKNDRFAMKSYEDVEVVKMQIYNRWGEMLFDTREPAEGWDGTYEGKPMPMGTYAYQVWMYCDERLKLHSGNVTLIR